ncbi:MAG: hypothetical protein E4H37_08800 [Gemmatimonadales bacterium]|nr:MAG: hypothetical protein E4H37_08800 [Gemmatimonadales bacterium]
MRFHGITMNGAGIIVLCVFCLALVECRQRESARDHAKIQINVPDEPYPGTRTKLITYDVQEGRELFEELFRSAKRVGMCSPAKVESELGAHEVMSVTFWGETVRPRRRFIILKSERGDWIQTGYGNVEIFDHPEGFPKYRYPEALVRRMKQWYETHIPEEQRKRWS